LKSWVVDASVAAKWFPPLDQEPLAIQARILLDQWRNGEVALIAPDFLWVELANIFWKALRTKRCSLFNAKSAVAAFRGHAVRTFPASELSDRTFQIASQHGRTVYDSVYVALAVESGSVLITADEKLANALAAHFPVKWLGAI
jgi:predicted nucleic acid-binding protein